MNNVVIKKGRPIVKERRLFNRIECLIATYCSVSGSRSFCKVVNRNEQGLEIESSAMLHEGAVVKFVDPIVGAQITMQAQVIWTDGNRAGLSIRDE
jgi:hypothetical protein